MKQKGSFISKSSLQKQDRFSIFSNFIFGKTQQQQQELLEKDNDLQLEELRVKMKTIKDVSHDIEAAIRDGNQILDEIVLCLFFSIVKSVDLSPKKKLN